MIGACEMCKAQLYWRYWRHIKQHEDQICPYIQIKSHVPVHVFASWACANDGGNSFLMRQINKKEVGISFF